MVRRGQRFESVRGLHKRPAKWPFLLRQWRTPIVRASLNLSPSSVPNISGALNSWLEQKASDFIEHLLGREGPSERGGQQAPGRLEPQEWHRPVSTYQAMALLLTKRAWEQFWDIGARDAGGTRAFDEPIARRSRPAGGKHTERSSFPRRPMIEYPTRWMSVQRSGVPIRPCQFRRTR